MPSGKVVLGGSWYCPADFRFNFDPSVRLDILGIRIVAKRRGE